jgi:cell division protease FtsH
MVGLWGMSEAIGPVAVIPEDEQMTFPGVAEVSPATAKLVDDEVKRIVDEGLEEVRVLLRDKRQRLDGLAEALLERETLDSEQAYAAAGVSRPEASGAEPVEAGVEAGFRTEN